MFLAQQLTARPVSRVRRATGQTGPRAGARRWGATPEMACWCLEFNMQFYRQTDFAAKLSTGGIARVATHDKAVLTHRIVGRHR